MEQRFRQQVYLAQARLLSFSMHTQLDFNLASIQKCQPTHGILHIGIWHNNTQH